MEPFYILQVKEILQKVRPHDTFRMTASACDAIQTVSNRHAKNHATITTCNAKHCSIN